MSILYATDYAPEEYLEDASNGITISIALVAQLVAQQQSATVEFEAVSIKPAELQCTRSYDPTVRGWNSRTQSPAVRIDYGRVASEPRSAHRRSRLVGDGRLGHRRPLSRRDSSAQVAQMMQAMLTDRFRLVVHRETRTLPTYAMTVAKGGIKLQQGDGRGGMSAGPRLIRFRSGTMGDLASQLSGYLGRNVIDRTGMAGQYAIDLSFAPVNPVEPAGDAGQDLGPSIFTALQDQAGLKLESTRGPVEVLVIDRAEKPMPN